MIATSGKIKPIILIAVLILPVGIFLFLKKFGENRFEVPIYHEKGLVFEGEGCNTESAPHIVPAILPGYSYESGLSIIFFREMDWNVPGGEYEQVVRVCEFIEDKPVRTFRISENSLEGSLCVSDVSVEKEKVEVWKKCGFALDDVGQWVLVDDLGRIRGYYEIDDREEADRLFMEIDILLENKGK